ncbi:intraflagellar transport protein 22 homolog [Planococcus citri]|uniref:intraflagellar transport protein 22 homolog n=1 Tax=Planococcus citri TaxID=170843 RepID=UPI0031F9BEF6
MHFIGNHYKTSNTSSTDRIMTAKLKVIVVGPQQAGKTLISNIITDMTENAYSQYEPTEGVRILEIETPVSLNTMQNSNVDIELWDCGGSQRYQPCWPVIQLDTQGIIFVCNPQSSDQLPELELLYDYFVTQNNMNDYNCVVFINQKSELDQISSMLPHRFDGVMRKTINAASNPNGVKSEFLNFIETLLSDLKH